MRQKRPDAPSAPTALRRLSIGMSMALAASERTQKDVAAECEITTTYLSKMLSGQKSPSQTILERFAAAVGFAISEIFNFGDQILEHEAKAERRAAIEQATRKKTVTTLAQAAKRLPPEELEELRSSLRALLAEGS